MQNVVRFAQHQFYYTFQYQQAFSTPEKRRDARFWQKKVSELEKKAEDLEYVKRHIGADEVDRIVDKVKKIQEVKKKNMKHQLIL